jgi:class 3 adenylate cyclase
LLVGRTAECQAIDRLLAKIRGGNGGALVVIGEPGIGKTALLEYALRQASDMRALSALGVEAEAAVPYAGLHTLLRPVLDGLGELPERQARAIRVALGQDEQGATDALAVYSGVLALLAEAAWQEPLVVVVDDAHWLDAETVQAIGFAARRIAEESIGILFGARSGEGFELRGVPELLVGGVDAAAANALISRARPGIPPEVARAVRDEAAGNPLALLELPRALEDSVLRGEKPIDGGVSLSAAIERAFLRRSERLSEAGRQAMLLAAACGENDLEIIGGIDAHLAYGLDEAQRVGLLKQDRGRIDFWHPLVRSAVYSAATEATRRAAHRMLANALADEQPARSAWHLVLSGCEADESVARALADAGETARRAGACSSAARLLDLAAAATPDDGRRALRLLRAGEAAWLSGNPQRAKSLLDRSEQLTEDATLAADIALARWWAATSLTDSLQDLFEPIVDRARDLPPADAHTAARILATAWDWAWNVLDIDRARRLADHAMAALAGDVTPADRELLTALAWQRLADFRVEEALAAARVVTEQPGSAPDLQVAFAAEVLSAADEHDEARTALGVAIGELSRLGHMPTLSYSLRTQATIELRRGRLLEAVKLAGEAQALSDEGTASWAGMADAEIAAVEAVAGLAGPCRAHAARASESFGGGDQWSHAEGQAAIGLLELGLGNDDAARLALDRAHEMLRPVGHPGFVRYAADRIEVLMRLGDQDEAQTAIADLRDRNQRAPLPWATHVLARAEMLTAPPEMLDTAYERVIASPVQSGFERARSSLVYGERLRRAGRRIDAREHLRTALDTFETLGSKPWERRAQSELRASGLRLRKRDEGSGDELTPQELQVALVVAEGVTNREAGARLFLSPKTIEVHLSRAYRKLGVRTRTELAHALAVSPPAVEPAPIQGRTLAALLFTDIVGSTDRAVAVGDRRWSALLSRHNQATAAAVERAGGRVIESTGDGVLAGFETPSSALRCAVAIRRALRKLDIDVRSAIHVGELEQMPGGNVRGIMVHVAARALGQAAAGQIVVTKAVQETARGTAFLFKSRGEVVLRGIGPVELYDAEPAT